MHFHPWHKKGEIPAKKGGGGSSSGRYPYCVQNSVSLMDPRIRALAILSPKQRRHKLGCIWPAVPVHAKSGLLCCFHCGTNGCPVQLIGEKVCKKTKEYRLKKIQIRRVQIYQSLLFFVTE